MEHYAIVDESSFPLITVRFTGNKSTDDNFQAYLNQVRAAYRSEKNIALLFDATEANIPSVSHQKMQANWLKENEGLMKRYCLGTSYIIPNAIIRNVLRMIFSIQKQPVPFQVFKTAAEAELWLNEKLRFKKTPSPALPPKYC